ncbi:hypothetical protein [Actinacidiphila glaucinigra]|uniref:hypothetical protein n=1 Tax=Actinacidiphila glaucinigra TaxID=235986 RepID=UPI00366EC4CD
MRRMLGPALLALLALSACTSEQDKTEQYWHGFHFGKDTATAYAKRVIDDTFSYCNSSELAARQDMCTQPGGPDTRYPTIAGERDCADNLPAGLEREEREAWDKGCRTGMALGVPDAVTYGTDPGQ